MPAMNALILSAGLGTRLRPLTDKLPKVMLNIGSKPLLEHHINHIKNHGITEIWINLYLLPEKITSHFKNGHTLKVKIKYSPESTSLGTAGALKNPHSQIENAFKKDDFLIVYGDNLTNFDYQKLLKFHKEKGAILTMGLYRHHEPWTMGVIETDSDGKILSMKEKPPKEEIKTNLVNAGVYVCSPKILKYIPTGFSDFGSDIIPKLISAGKPIYGLETNAYVQDIGTPERLKKARQDFRKGKIKLYVNK